MWGRKEIIKIINGGVDRLMDNGSASLLQVSAETVCVHFVPMPLGKGINPFLHSAMGK